MPPNDSNLLNLFHLFYFLKFLEQFPGAARVISEDRLERIEEAVLVEGVFVCFKSFEHLFYQIQNRVPTVRFNLKLHSSENAGKHEALGLSLSDFLEAFTCCVMEIRKFLAHRHSGNTVLRH